VGETGQVVHLGHPNGVLRVTLRVGLRTDGQISGNQRLGPATNREVQPEAIRQLDRD
jgi:hypothetical protein